MKEQMMAESSVAACLLCFMKCSMLHNQKEKQNMPQLKPLALLAQYASYAIGRQWRIANNLPADV